jgi:hypothetical protein
LESPTKNCALEAVFPETPFEVIRR